MPSRVNRRSLNPETIAPIKKDQSFLDWHYKTPTEEELSDPYECFPEEFWAPYFQAAKEATTLPPRKKKDPLILKEAIKRDACDDCILPYQILMQRLGKCKPAYGAVTPEDRLDLIDE